MDRHRIARSVTGHQLFLAASSASICLLTARPTLDSLSRIPGETRSRQCTARDCISPKFDRTELREPRLAQSRLPRINYSGMRWPISPRDIRRAGSHTRRGETACSANRQIGKSAAGCGTMDNAIDARFGALLLAHGSRRLKRQSARARAIGGNGVAAASGGFQTGCYKQAS